MVATMTQQILLVGKGIYSFPRASQLTGIPVQNLRRWTLGRPADPESLSSRPIIGLELPSIDSEEALSFLNLVELKLIGEFRHLGLPLQYIRRVVQVLQESYNLEHPLACKRLLTDGSSVFAEIEEEGDFACIEVAGRRPGNAVLEDVVRPFFRNLEFYAGTDLARRWFPAGASGRIVVDPAIALGEPTIADFGVPTSVLAALVNAGDAPRDVADWYELPADDVMRAVEFEGHLLKRTAA
jgi:uncharacterized protein (DUF433 family)